MRTYHRNFIYESSDFDNMCKFIIQDHSSKKDYFVWHIGCIVDWKYGLFNLEKHFPDNFSKGAHLWFDYFHNMIGFVISEDFNNDFSVFLKDSHSHMYPELLRWVETEWGCRYDTLVTSAVEHQTELIDVLEAQGYKRTDQMEKTRILDTSIFRNYMIDDSSVSFRSMAENGDYTEQAVLRRNAWSKDISEEMERQIREYTRRSPIYNAHFDFVLVNKEGRHVSGCEAFLDYENNTAEIERVCTHSDFYNKGYAQKVLMACMRKLYESNIMTAFLTGGYDKTFHLYGKLGHIKEFTKYFYEKKISK